MERLLITYNKDNEFLQVIEILKKEMIDACRIPEDLLCAQSTTSSGVQCILARFKQLVVRNK